MPAEIHKIDGTNIAAGVVDLEDGQRWNDECVVTFRRDEANMLAIVMANYLDDAKEAIRAAERKSVRTDVDALERIGAMLASYKLAESWRLAARAHAAVGSAIAPTKERQEIADALAEVRAQADAEDAEKEQAETQTEPES